MSEQRMAPEPAQVQAPEPGLLDILRIINHHRGLLIAMSILGVALALVALAMIRPLYQAEAVVLIAPKEAGDDTHLVREVMVGDDNTVIETQVRILRSRSLAKSVLAGIDSAHLAALAHAGPPPLLRPFLGNAPAPAGDLDEKSRIDLFLGGLDVARDGKSNAILVRYTGTDPELAAHLANATAERYLADQSAAKHEANQRARVWLAEQAQIAQAELEAAEAALEALRVASSQENADAIAVHGVDVVNIKRDLAAASAERAAKEVELRRKRTVAAHAGPPAAFEDLGGSPVLQNLFALQNQTLRREAELSSQYGSRHPAIIDTRAELREINARILAERTALVERAAADLDAAKARERTLQRELDGLKTQTVAQRDADAEIEALSHEVELSRVLYHDYIARLQDVGLRQDMQEPDGRILSAAVAPLKPFFPNAPMMLGGGWLAAFATGLLLIYLLEQSDRGLGTPRQLERLLGVPCLASLPQIQAGRGARLEPADYVREKPQSRFAENLRGLLSSFEQGHGEGYVVLITSSLPGEGKSTTALALGRVAESEGLATVVVDADLRRPRLRQLLNRPLGPGLVDVLRGDAELDQALHADLGEHEPDVLMGTRRGDAPVQSLGHDGMRHLLQELRERYDVVIIDTAPLAAVADARVLARMADSTVLLARWNRTPAALVEESLRGLREAGAHIAGAVLTLVDLKRLACQGSEAHINAHHLAAYYTD